MNCMQGFQSWLEFFYKRANQLDFFFFFRDLRRVGEEDHKHGSFDVVVLILHKGLDQVNQPLTQNDARFFTSGVNFTNILLTAFTLVNPKSVKNTVNSSVSFCAFGIYEHKSCTQNIDEIDGSCQFHQHFALKFFKQKCFAQLFFNYSLTL